MTHGSTLALVLAALCSALALGSCRTASPDSTTALARLSPVSDATASASALPALSLATRTADAASAYERAVAHASMSYEFEKQSCEALAGASRATCLATAFDHFADSRARAHAARMSALAGG